MHVKSGPPPDTSAPPKALRAFTKLAKCLECSKIYTKRRRWQKFCKSKCRDSFHNRNRILIEVTEVDLKNKD